MLKCLEEDPLLLDHDDDCDNGVVGSPLGSSSYSVGHHLAEGLDVAVCATSQQLWGVRAMDGLGTILIPPLTGPENDSSLLEVLTLGHSLRVSPVRDIAKRIS